MVWGRVETVLLVVGPLACSVGVGVDPIGNAEPSKGTGGSVSSAAVDAGSGGRQNQKPPDAPDDEPPLPPEDPPVGTAGATGGTESASGGAPSAGRPGETRGEGGEGGAPVVSPPSCAEGAAYELELVAPDVGSHIDASVAVDAHGVVSVAYTNRQGAFLARRGAAGFSIETIETGASDFWGAALVLDAAGMPHVSYTKYAEAVVHATRLSSGSWLRETIDVAGGRSTALALDRTGAAHVTYYVEGGHSSLCYATQGELGWDVVVIDDAAYDRGSSVAIDDAGAAHISYYTGGLAYATNTSGAFVIEHSEGGLDSSLVLDDGPVISHALTPSGFGDVTISRPGNLGTHGTPIATGYGTSLAIDESHALHVAFGIDNKVGYATNRDGEFAVEVFDPGVSPWSMPSLALADGEPLLAFATRDTPADGLYLARLCPR
jgi:hypothetical protein